MSSPDTDPSVSRRADFERDGWVRVPGLVPADLCDDVRRDLAPHFDRGAARLLHAWEVSAPVRTLAVHPPVIELVAGLLGQPVVAFQTLDFRRGTEQDAHADSLFFDTWPRGAMCGAWVALEDVSPASGPLRLWPRSHRRGGLWPGDLGDADGRPRTVHEAYAARDRLDEPVDVTAARGDVVVWAADLLHGGAPIEDAATTRWSQVTHYVATGHVYLSPLTSDPAAEHFMVRDQLVDVATGRRVPHRQGDRAVVFAHGREGRSRIVVDPTPATRVRLAGRDLLHGAPRARRRVAPVLRRQLRRLRRRPLAS